MDVHRVGRSKTKAALSALAACVLAGCGNDDTRWLDPVSVALSERVAPAYDDGELTIYEAKAELMLPIVAPTADDMERLWSEQPDPFPRQPWVTREDVEVELTWTLSNLDAAPHAIWVMVDPWNEFGRYEPAVRVDGDEAVRDLSGIDMLFELPGVGGGAEPRVLGTFTYDDMAELALDFATVFKVLADAAPAPGAEEEDPRSTLVNHAFNVRNRSYNSPLLAPYRPATVPALVGFTFGIRASEPANVALEIVAEVRDRQGDRVAARGELAPLLEAPTAVISLVEP